VPITFAAAAAPLVLRETHDGTARRLDVAGAPMITLALLGLIYGLSRGGQAGFDDPLTRASLIGATALASAVVLVERRSVDPLVPFRLLRLPTLAGTDLTSSWVRTLVSATPFFLSLYLQHVLELTPVQTGVAFLPMALTIMAASALAARLAEPSASSRYSSPTSPP
jgi:hypothetical protein